MAGASISLPRQGVRACCDSLGCRLAGAGRMTRRIKMKSQQEEYEEEQE
jgi:hypothetical protein